MEFDQSHWVGPLKKEWPKVWTAFTNCFDKVTVLSEGIHDKHIMNDSSIVFHAEIIR